MYMTIILFPRLGVQQSAVQCYNLSSTRLSARPEILYTAPGTERLYNDLFLRFGHFLDEFVVLCTILFMGKYCRKYIHKS